MGKIMSHDKTETIKAKTPEGDIELEIKLKFKHGTKVKHWIELCRKLGEGVSVDGAETIDMDFEKCVELGEVAFRMDKPEAGGSEFSAGVEFYDPQAAMEAFAVSQADHPIFVKVIQMPKPLDTKGGKKQTAGSRRRGTRRQTAEPVQ